MKTTFRSYQPYQDASRVSEFLARTYPPTDRNPNWTRAWWEYMVYAVQDGVEENLASFGVWESGTEIVGVANFENGLGEVYLQVHPDHTHLQAEMLGYAETVLSRTEEGEKRLAIWVNAFDDALPEGFQITYRQERGALRAIHVLWCGFNHEGPDPEQYVACRADVEKAPMYRGDLTAMVRAPEGHLASYC